MCWGMSVRLGRREGNGGFNGEGRQRKREGRDRMRVEARVMFENEKARWCLYGGGGTRVFVR